VPTSNPIGLCLRFTTPSLLSLKRAEGAVNLKPVHGSRLRRFLLLCLEGLVWFAVCGWSTPSSSSFGGLVWFTVWFTPLSLSSPLGSGWWCWLAVHGSWFAPPLSSFFEEPLDVWFGSRFAIGARLLLLMWGSGLVHGLVYTAFFIFTFGVWLVVLVDGLVWFGLVAFIFFL
jgi:hypothetical protein